MKTAVMGSIDMTEKCKREMDNQIEAARLICRRNRRAVEKLTAEELIEVLMRLAPGLVGWNLEYYAAAVFEAAKRLKVGAKEE